MEHVCDVMCVNIAYLKFLHGELMALFLGTGEDVVKHMAAALCVSLELLLDHLLHAAMQDISCLDTLTTPQNRIKMVASCNKCA